MPTLPGVRRELGVRSGSLQLRREHLPGSVQFKVFDSVIPSLCVVPQLAPGRQQGWLLFLSSGIRRSKCRRLDVQALQHIHRCMLTLSNLLPSFRVLREVLLCTLPQEYLQAEGELNSAFQEPTGTSILELVFASDSF